MKQKKDEIKVSVQASWRSEMLQHLVARREIAMTDYPSTHVVEQQSSTRGGWGGDKW